MTKKIIYQGLTTTNPGHDGPYESTTPRMDSIEDVLVWHYRPNDKKQPLDLVGQYAEEEDGTLTHLQDYEMKWEVFNGE